MIPGRWRNRLVRSPSPGVKAVCRKRGVKGQSLVAMRANANINFDRLRHVAERAELGERREALLAVEIPESLAAF